MFGSVSVASSSQDESSKLLDNLKRIEAKASVEMGSREFFNTYWKDSMSREEKTKALVIMLRDVVFTIPQHEEKVLETTNQNTDDTRQRRLQRILEAGQGQVQNFMELFRQLADNNNSGPTRPVEQVSADESIDRAGLWLRYFLCLGNIGKEKFYDSILTTNRGVCGKAWTVGQIAFKCRTCQKDPTCAICEECFRKGNHEGHDYTMTTSSNGMCDCGDEEAWSISGFCCDHKGRSDPLAHLSDTYKQVLEAIIHSLFGVDGVLKRYISAITSKYDSLKDEIARTSSFQLQTLCQNFNGVLECITETINHSPCLKNLAYFEMSKNVTNNSTTVLDFFLSRNCKLSRSNKSKMYFLYSSLIADADFKLFFATRFVAHYSGIIEDYVTYLKKKQSHEEEEEEEEEVHISSLSVQLFTTPTVASHLIEKCNLVSVLLDSLIELAEDEASMDDSRNNRLFYKPNPTRSKKLNALYHVIYDVMYCVMHRQFCDELLLNDDCFHKFLTFLSYIQASSDVKRLDTDESQWYVIFNLEMATLPKLMRNIASFIQYYTDETCYYKIIKQLVSFLSKFVQDDNIELDENGLVKNSKPFNIPITFHLPINRMTTTIIVELMNRFPTISLKDTISKVLSEISSSEGDISAKFLLEILEHPLKEFVVGAQINARLWQRNHEHSKFQLHHYSDHT